MSVKKLRLCAGILAVVLALTGCAGKTGGEAKAVNPVNVTETHKSTNTLHKVTVKESERPFVTDGKSEYKIIAGKDENTKKAASYLMVYIEKATGCRLEYAEVKDYQANGKYIVFNVPELFTSSGLAMPEDELGVNGYYIKTVGDTVFLASNYDQGARFAMLAFLRNVLGFKMYALDAVVFEEDGSTMPDMDIIERPDLPYFQRMHNSGDDPEETYMMGFIVDPFIRIDGDPYHNSLTYLPMEQYKEAHPDWYSTEGNELCYTAHGNEKEWNQMVDIIANRMLAEAAADPDGLFITCTIMDHTTSCICDACVESAIKYNGANSAAVVKFINAINRKVQAGLQKQADETGTKKRPLTVAFFAYNAMTKPPVKQNADGTFSPIDESVKLDDEVAAFYAPIKAEYNHTFYSTNNETFYMMMQGWKACGDQLLCWLYETNFYYYFYPYNCWDSMMETYRFCVDTGTMFIIGQDQHDTGASSGFTDFKDYINSCAVFDINRDYKEIVDDYFTNYYQDAAEPMRTYFDELRAWMRYLENEYPAEYNGSIYAEVAKSKFWPKMMLEHWLDLIDEAYAATETYRDQKALYKSLNDRITKESMFMRYVLIEHYSGTYSEEVLNEMKLSFKEDAQRLGFSRYGEKKDMSNVYKAWGVE